MNEELLWRSLPTLKPLAKSIKEGDEDAWDPLKDLLIECDCELVATDHYRCSWTTTCALVITLAGTDFRPVVGNSKLIFDGMEFERILVFLQQDQIRIQNPVNIQ